MNSLLLDFFFSSCTLADVEVLSGCQHLSFRRKVQQVPADITSDAAGIIRPLFNTLSCSSCCCRPPKCLFVIFSLGDIALWSHSLVVLRDWGREAEGKITWSLECSALLWMSSRKHIAIRIKERSSVKLRLKKRDNVAELFTMLKNKPPMQQHLCLDNILYCLWLTDDRFTVC